MNEDYTFQQAVHAIDRATVTGRPFPRLFRDNGPVSRLLALDFSTESGFDAWLDYFGAKAEGTIAWAHEWHGWTVLMTAHFSDADVEDSGPVGTEQRTPPADPGTALLAEGESESAYYWTPEWQADEKIAADELARGEGVAFDTPDEAVRWLTTPDADSTGEACIEAAARRVHGLHRAADLDNAPWAMAALTPDAAIDMPCGQTSRRETHLAHTRHVGACSRYCLGWANEPTAEMAVQS